MEILKKSCVYVLLGKQVIHPAQIDVVNQMFSPTKQQIDYSTRLVDAFNQHQVSGAVSKHPLFLSIPIY